MIDKMIDDCIKLNENANKGFIKKIISGLSGAIKESKKYIKSFFNRGKNSVQDKVESKQDDKQIVNDTYDDYKEIVEDSNVEVFSMLTVGRDSIASKFCQNAVFTTIKDERRCEICKSKQGLRVKVGSNEYKENMPPLHNRCRCIYTYILERNY